MALPSLSLSPPLIHPKLETEGGSSSSLSHPFSILHNALRDFSLSERVLLPGLAIHDAGREQRAEDENIQFASFTCAAPALHAIV